MKRARWWSYACSGTLGLILYSAGMTLQSWETWVLMVGVNFWAAAERMAD